MLIHIYTCTQARMTMDRLKENQHVSKADLINLDCMLSIVLYALEEAA